LNGAKIHGLLYNLGVIMQLQRFVVHCRKRISPKGQEHARDDAILPGDTNHSISGSPTIDVTALEHDRSNGPLTLTTGTAEISNTLGAGAEETSLAATATAGATALEGSREFVALKMLDVADL
jgi:hypothetical protein